MFHPSLYDTGAQSLVTRVVFISNTFLLAIYLCILTYYYVQKLFLIIFSLYLILALVYLWKLNFRVPKVPFEVKNGRLFLFLLNAYCGFFLMLLSLILGFNIGSLFLLPVLTIGTVSAILIAFSLYQVVAMKLYCKRWESEHPEYLKLTKK